MSERIPVNQPRGNQGAATEERAIKLDVQPANLQQFARLIDFTRELLGVCNSLEIEPVASGSLVV